MEWKECKVVESFVCSINDMFGNCISISMNRGKKFEYRLDGEKLILLSKGVRLVIPKNEFNKFKELC